MLGNMHVVSFCHYLQGPAATQYLADVGAEVIKIEAPKDAFERHWSGAILAGLGYSGSETEALIDKEVVFALA